jgi:large subunit ribosomal protein L18
MSKVNTRKARLRRHTRVRAKIEGTPECPRLCVFRSLNHIYAQVTDDRKGHTIVSASTLDPEIKSQVEGKSKTDQAKLVGTILASKAIDAGIVNIVFDRGGFKYQGRVKALADGARAGGLKF